MVPPFLHFRSPHRGSCPAKNGIPYLTSPYKDYNNALLKGHRADPPHKLEYCNTLDHNRADPALYKEEYYNTSDHHTEDLALYKDEYYNTSDYHTENPVLQRGIILHFRYPI